MFKHFKTGLVGLLLITGAGAGAAALDLSAVNEAKLDKILENRPAEQKARDKFRHPKEVIELLGLKPGMTVIDTLPGSWYGNILVPYLGADGKYIGAFYSNERYQDMFGERYNNNRERYVTRAPKFVEDAKDYGNVDNPPEFDAIRVGAAPASMLGTADAWLFFRALHHLNKFDSRDLDDAAAEAFWVLKPGGVVGVVQHRAAEDASDKFARGFSGYVKQSRVIDAFTQAGFILEATSEVNANPKDQPGEDDIVWRLPPSTQTDAAKAIGESDRMTLVFRKPLAEDAR